MRKFFKQLKWYWFTRSGGAIAALYEFGFDHSPGRAEIIVGAFGLIGLDSVSRKERESVEERKEARAERREEKENQEKLLHEKEKRQEGDA